MQVKVNEESEKMMKIHQSLTLKVKAQEKTQSLDRMIVNTVPPVGISQNEDIKKDAVLPDKMQELLDKCKNTNVWFASSI